LSQEPDDPTRELMRAILHSLGDGLPQEFAGMATAFVTEGLAASRADVLKALHFLDLEGLVKMVNVGVYRITDKGRQRASPA
jgi:DNA-binding PadR family transcriptional regulator